MSLFVNVFMYECRLNGKIWEKCTKTHTKKMKKKTENGK